MALIAGPNGCYWGHKSIHPLKIYPQNSIVLFFTNLSDPQSVLKTYGALFHSGLVNSDDEPPEQLKPNKVIISARL